MVIRSTIVESIIVEPIIIEYTIVQLVVILIGWTTIRKLGMDWFERFHLIIRLNPISILLVLLLVIVILVILVPILSFISLLRTALPHHLLIDSILPVLRGSFLHLHPWLTNP